MKAGIMTNFLQLTKPTILILVALTGLTTLVMEGSLVTRPVWSVFMVLMIAVCGGAANSFNQFIERDRDALMIRTRGRRPLPMGRLTPLAALVFSFFLSVISVISFAVFANFLSALLALGTILFYTVIYTLWLKPRTPQNIVIGGIAGAAAPLIAGAALTGSVSPLAWILFFIVFLWTPPHFWALALHYKEDYAAVGIPMLPVTHGEEATRKQILIYSLILVPFTLLQVALGLSGWIYFVVALFVGGLFLQKALRLFRQHHSEGAHRFFLFSIVYLFALFIAMMGDRLYFVRVFS